MRWLSDPAGEGDWHSPTPERDGSRRPARGNAQLTPCVRGSFDFRTTCPRKSIATIHPCAGTANADAATPVPGHQKTDAGANFSLLPPRGSNGQGTTPNTSQVSAARHTRPMKPPAGRGVRLAPIAFPDPQRIALPVASAFPDCMGRRKRVPNWRDGKLFAKTCHVIHSWIGSPRRLYG